MTIAQEIGNMVSILPESDQNMILELVKRCVLAWDPDYTKLTPQEAMALESCKDEEYIPAVEIDWDNLDSYL